MSVNPAEPVEASSVGVAGLAESAGERVSRLGCRDQMDVIRHKAIAEQAEPVVAALAAQGIEVRTAVFVGQGDSPAVVSALGDDVRKWQDVGIARVARAMAAARVGDQAILLGVGVAFGPGGGGNRWGSKQGRHGLLPLQAELVRHFSANR